VLYCGKDANVYPKNERRTTDDSWKGGGGRRRISRDARFRNNRDFSIYPPKQTLRCSVTSDKTDASRRISDTRGRSSRSQIITRYDAARARAHARTRSYRSRNIVSGLRASPVKKDGSGRDNALSVTTSAALISAGFRPRFHGVITGSRARECRLGRP